LALLEWRGGHRGLRGLPVLRPSVVVADALAEFAILCGPDGGARAASRGWRRRRRRVFDRGCSRSARPGRVAARCGAAGGGAGIHSGGARGTNGVNSSRVVSPLRVFASPTLPRSTPPFLTSTTQPCLDACRRAAGRRRERYSRCGAAGALAGPFSVGGRKCRRRRGRVRRGRAGVWRTAADAAPYPSRHAVCWRPPSPTTRHRRVLAYGACACRRRRAVCPAAAAVHSAPHRHRGRRRLGSQPHRPGLAAAASPRRGCGADVARERSVGTPFSLSLTSGHAAVTPPPCVAQPPSPAARRSFFVKQVPPSCYQLPATGAGPSPTSRVAALTVLTHCDAAWLTALVTLFATRVPRSLRSCGCT